MDDAKTLVLRRRSGQTIKIGDNVVVKVRKLTKSICTVAISAPEQVVILRGELERKDA